MSSRGFTWNIESYFLWKTMKKYFWVSYGTVVTGAFLKELILESHLSL